MPEVTEVRTTETAATPEGSVSVETRSVETPEPAPPPPPPEPEEPKWLSKLVTMHAQTSEQFTSALSTLAESQKAMLERQQQTDEHLSALEALLTEEPETPNEIDGVPLPASAPPAPANAPASDGTSSAPPANAGGTSHPAPAVPPPAAPERVPEPKPKKHRWI